MGSSPRLLRRDSCLKRSVLRVLPLSGSAVPAEPPATLPAGAPAIPAPPDSDAEPELRVEAPNPNPLRYPGIMNLRIPYSSTDPVTPPLSVGIPAIPLPPVTARPGSADTSLQTLYPQAYDVQPAFRFSPPMILPFPPSTSTDPAPLPLRLYPHAYPALLQVALRSAANEEQRFALRAALEASLPAASLTATP